MTSTSSAEPAGATADASRGGAGTSRATWISIFCLATWAYLLYGIGNATPYLRTDLHLSDFEAGLHASALAIGVLAAGASADFFGRRIGASRLQDVAVGELIAGVLLVSFAPGLAVSLAGALLLGLGGGTLGTQVNVVLVRSAGGDSRQVMGQANAVSMIFAAAAPVVMGLATSGLHAWRLALLLPIAAFLILTVLRPREKFTRATVRAPRAKLTRPYWFVWLLLVLSVSIEFSFVFWGSTIVGRRTGVSDADSTLLASLFVAGMFVARAAIWRGLGASRSPMLIMSGGLVVVLAGASLVWVSTVPALSGLGLFLGGMGTAGLWPVGIAVALAAAPKAPFEASARATFGSGIAVFAAPSLLGLFADAVGVVAAWPIILGLAVAALAVIAVTPRPATTNPSEAAAVEPAPAVLP